ncbi:dTDP-4-dehydrorhamnose 3,5-epimerase [Hoeflea marina]|uniref:dTDP-4-dehydrorhamnose 3,5-epimerase n=1 Tax=Hoeflea marina TaxID=274592 RepID=A0A317PKB6_9HYPH|nr:dTDP-4-dehydrorhamnose 3,5-epimerase [Hoeflea marina]PWW00238.1 dTDP-4-dehydrorhamnose 3,5-epimerase [Hoeflea marina]
MPRFTRLALPEVIEVVPDRFADPRGFFSEVYNRAVWREGGIDADFVQDNHSLSRQPGTLRGLHFQTPPMAQAKLVRVSRGRAFDVAVDIRAGSPSYLGWVGVELSAERGNQLFIPEGFAHGFLTLEPDTEFLYKVSAAWSRPHDRSIRYDDAAIGIRWPAPVDPDALSPKDRDAPALAATDTGFVY